MEDFKRRLDEEKEMIKKLPYSMEELKGIYRQEYEFKENMPNLNLKMEAQELDSKVIKSYLPEKWEMPRNGKLLYNDEELLNVLKLLVFNIGVKKSLDSIPINLIEQYVHKNNRKKEDMP